jgi:hypothetical protein
MKRTLTRRAMFDGKMLNFTFEYWPPYPASRTQPEEAAEINVLSITDLEGNNVPVPPYEDSNKETESDRMLELLFDIISNENDYSEQTMVVEPWD